MRTDGQNDKANRLFVIIMFISVVFYNKLDWSVSTNTTIIYIYYLLHRKQLHVSALDDGHLHVVYENT